ncbi:hypothetical protein BCV69DRAFT_216079 [Microstroma glucosiphilum]|uniref:Uncharacterized protein n=1 Tax=Pseudomicrostroma glucosiphilum TaxID=1684307 RepID=A0A316U3Z9_9BASI|nr:hypothetical protein BCV69DRAFT_216079 [Pseudomicrostroma glucosiphilum]PWN20009.1 hypothetical protein BCV69DRAFT_216079 [Pseudomicrostroma glucosiphilum]
MIHTVYDHIWTRSGPGGCSPPVRYVRAISRPFRSRRRKDHRRLFRHTGAREERRQGDPPTLILRPMASTPSSGGLVLPHLHAGTLLLLHHACIGNLFHDFREPQPAKFA